jgi:hypothetical protein
MSGLAAVEPKWEVGRNLCFNLYETATPTTQKSNWSRLVTDIDNLFGAQLLPPQYVQERGEITMTYQEQSGIKLDISSAGRGFQQTLLLLAHLYANPNTVLLLDEPDAYLEILRQRQIYQRITDIAQEQNAQVIAASHSEVILNEAAERDTVIALIGSPHSLAGKKTSQVMKALTQLPPRRSPFRLARILPCQLAAVCRPTFIKTSHSAWEMSVTAVQSVAANTLGSRDKLETRIDKRGNEKRVREDLVLPQ